MSSFVREKGHISVHTKNILAAVKHYFYPDHELFLVELICNAIDATEKIKKLAQLGEYSGELGDLKVRVTLNKAAKTISVHDRGIGMSSDEVKKNINKIAFSSLKEIIEKLSPPDIPLTATGKNISRFGLGFYAAFMVAEEVQIITKSFKEDAEALRWTVDGSTEFTIEPTYKTDRGTDIILYIDEHSEEFLSRSRLRQILEKYCSYLPVAIEFDGYIINHPKAVWTQPPLELHSQDYLSFYRELYPKCDDPLFWIHLNVDYPFNLMGILYFPNFNNNTDFWAKKEKMRFYRRQVFITDDVMGIFPDYLQLLSGVIDSPDIPLDVPAHFLESNPTVQKINVYIGRQIADKLSEMFRIDRSAYEAIFDTIATFVKYGMLTDEVFAEKALEFCLVKNRLGDFFTVEEYMAKIKANQTDKNGNVIWLFANDYLKQTIYFQWADERGYDVLIFNSFIDPQFINTLEHKLENTTFKRIDSDIPDKLIEKENQPVSRLSKQEEENLKMLFEATLGNSAELTFTVEAMSADELVAIVTIPEFLRRMYEIDYGGLLVNGPLALNLAVNANGPLAKTILSSDENNQTQWVREVYRRALQMQEALPDSVHIKKRHNESQLTKEKSTPLAETLLQDLEEGVELHITISDKDISMSKAGYLLYSFGTALESIPEVSFLIKELIVGSLVIKSELKVENRESARQVTSLLSHLKEKMETGNLNILEDQKDSLVHEKEGILKSKAEVKASRDEINSPILSSSGQSVLKDELELELLRLSVEEKKLELESKRIDNELKQIQSFREKIDLIETGVKAFGEVTLTLNGTQYIKYPPELKNNSSTSILTKPNQ